MHINTTFNTFNLWKGIKCWNFIVINKIVVLFCRVVPVKTHINTVLDCSRHCTLLLKFTSLMSK